MKHLPAFATLLAAATAGLLLAGCTTPANRTTMLSAWADPSAKAKFQAGGNVLTIYPINEPTMRRTVENRMSKWIKNAEPSYSVINEEDFGDPDKARAAVEKGGYDFVVALRVADIKQEAYQDSTVQWHDAQPYYDYYWGYTAYVFDVGAYFARDYTILSTTLDVESLIFDGKTGRKLFASRSRIEKPQEVDRIIDEIIIAVKDTMRGAGLVP